MYTRTTPQTHHMSVESSPHFDALLLKDPFYYYPSVYTWICQVVSHFQSSNENFARISHFSHAYYMPDICSGSGMWSRVQIM
jgi:hypothetical protein